MAILIPAGIQERLPRGRRNVADTLRRHLSNERFILWWEPAFDLEGSGLKPHFVLMDRSRGLLVLEVLEHQVMRFAGEGIKVAIEGFPGQIDKAPQARAEKLADQLSKLFANDEVLQDLPIRVCWAVVFPRLSKAQAQRIGIGNFAHPANAIFKDDLERPDRLLEAIEQLLWIQGREADFFVDDVIDRMRVLLHPETRIPVQGSLFSDIDDSDIFRAMDLRQENAARRIGSGHRLIRGVAGSGKTVILVARARLLAEHFPKRKILVTCFNKTLAEFLKIQLLGAGNKNVTVRHLSSLAWGLIHDAGLPQPNFRDRPAVALRAREAACRGAGDRYDTILVDEAQDFEKEEIELIRKVFKENKDELLFVADAAQKIYKKGFSWKAAGFDMTGRTTVLKKNYRNTKQILEFGLLFLTAGASMDLASDEEITKNPDAEVMIHPDEAVRSGPEPRVVLCDSKVPIAVATKLVGDVTNTNSPRRTTAVLYPNRDDNAIPKLEKDLKRIGLSTLVIQSNPDTRDQLAKTDARVILSTIHHAKGLEFDNVVLWNLSDGNASDPDARRLLYVGMTRARQHLTVCVRRGSILAEVMASLA